MIDIQLLGGESTYNSIYYYSKNHIVWTDYDEDTQIHTTSFRNINIPKILSLPFLRAFRILYAKSKLYGNSILLSSLLLLGIMALTQMFLSVGSILLAGLFPFLSWYLQIALTNLLIKSDKNSILKHQWKNHSAEHLIANNNKSIYSFGCSNSVIPIWLIINLILIWFMPVPLAFIISGFIASQFIAILYFHQNSIIAKLYYPLMKFTQQFTLLEPEEQHIKTATLTMDYLRWLENEM